MSATVILSRGQKTVTNAMGDGQPLAQPAPEDFPSIAELFALLKQAQQSGCWRVAAICDESLGYPVWCLIERKTREGLPVKQVDHFRITGLTSIPGEPANPLERVSSSRF